MFDSSVIGTENLCVAFVAACHFGVSAFFRVARRKNECRELFYAHVDNIEHRNIRDADILVDTFSHVEFGYWAVCFLFALFCGLDWCDATDLRKISAKRVS